MFTSSLLSFEQLQSRLLTAIRLKIANGEFTERGLARIAGISQPHIHHILKGQRSLTSDTADSLLTCLNLSLLDLIDFNMLSQALLDRQAEAGAPRLLPLLTGRLGPYDRFPDGCDISEWIRVPAQLLQKVRRPALVECAAVSTGYSANNQSLFALLDQDEAVRARPSPHCWYALRWRGAGFIGQISHSPAGLAITSHSAPPQSPSARELCPSLPSHLDLSGASILQVVRARVFWLGPDPRLFDPFAQVPLRLPDPPADS